MTKAPETRLHEVSDLQPAPAFDANGKLNGYIPSDDESYMNEQQKDYFRQLLLSWKQELQEKSSETFNGMRESNHNADPLDVASHEYDLTRNLRTRDRESKLLKKIDEALERIENDEFGFCEETGDPIGIPRLLARPITTLSIEAKRRQEKHETGYAD